jgi:CheY-like chemotaxis protein
MKKVMVVDDDRVMLRLYQLQVRRAGCEGFYFATANEAIFWLQENVPDLAVLDYNLPETSGSELLAQMRQRYPEPAIPVIFVTGTADPETLKVINQCADSHVLSKPFSPRRLQTLIEECLK